nr:MAG TPA: hypothetical protein [Caudoviricetes sp.]
MIRSSSASDAWNTSIVARCLSCEVGGGLSCPPSLGVHII